jgi:hypothetical protein
LHCFTAALVLCCTSKLCALWIHCSNIGLYPSIGKKEGAISRPFFIYIVTILISQANHERLLQVETRGRMNLQITAIKVTPHLIDHIILIQVCNVSRTRIEYRNNAFIDLDAVEIGTITIGRVENGRQCKGVCSGTLIVTKYVLICLTVFRLFPRLSKIFSVNFKPVICYTRDNTGKHLVIG